MKVLVIIMKFSELDIVRTSKAFPVHKLKKGEEGTIIDVYEKPVEGYMVEFSDETGEPYCTMSFRPEDLELVISYEDMKKTN